MRTKVLTSSLLVFSGVLLLGLSSCIGEQPKPEAEKPQIETEELTSSQIALVVEQASKQANYLKMKSISPNTGSSPKYSYDVKAIKYNSSTQHATVELRVTWRAKTAQLAEKVDVCEMTGQLSVNFVNRKSGVVSATYIPSTCNEWARYCGKSYGLSEAEVLKAITFDPYKK